MGPKTELLLYHLLWMAETISRPTCRNLCENFECWAYRSGLLRHIHHLEAEEFISSQGRSLNRIIHITEKGRRFVLGNREPEKLWAEEWDGVWRMVIFDVPERERRLRQDLRLQLKAMHFGCLQKSVWIAPRPVSDLAKSLAKLPRESASLILMESKSHSARDASDIVRSAWDFKTINEGYLDYRAFLDEWRKHPAREPLQERVAEEKELWNRPFSMDPLLPSELLPKDYAGKAAYRQRKATLPRLVHLVT